MNIRDINEMKLLSELYSYDKKSLYKRMLVIRRKIKVGELSKIIELHPVLNIGKTSTFILQPEVILTSTNPYATIRTFNKIVQGYCKIKYEELLNKYEEDFKF